MIPLVAFSLGAVALSSAVAGTFFLRFWRSTRDRLFFFFAIAFYVLALNWTSLAWYSAQHEKQPYLYLIRLVAFLLIIVGIIDKNRRTGTRR